jgi:hypothetical protein
MRLLVHGAAVLVGAAVAVAAVMVHRSVVLGVPLGLLIALATSFVTLWAMRDMLPRLASSYALGWLVAFGFALFGRPEGDYVVASDLRGYAMMVAGFVMLAIGVVSLTSRRALPGASAT